MDKFRMGFATLLFGAFAAVTAVAGPVNINTADAATLADELSGVGPALAKAIIEDRTENGRYETPEALMRVSGIGERVIEVNKPNILVEDAAEQAEAE